MPWLESDEWQGDNGILGNRRGFEQLRECIDLLLKGSDDLVPVDVDGSSIKILKIMDQPAEMPPMKIGERIFLCCFLGLFLIILLIGIIGLITFIIALFS